MSSPLPGGTAGTQPQQHLVVPLPAPNPLHQSCHPGSRGVPATFQGHEGPVPSAPAALRGPGARVAPRVAPFCTELPGFAFPTGIAAGFSLFPQLWAVPQKQEVRVTAHVGGVPGPGCAVPALPGRAGSTQQCCRLARAVSALSEQSWAQLLPAALLPGRVPSSAGIAAFESASAVGLAALNPLHNWENKCKLVF